MAKSNCPIPALRTTKSRRHLFCFKICSTLSMAALNALLDLEEFVEVDGEDVVVAVIVPAVIISNGIVHTFMAPSTLALLLSSLSSLDTVTDSDDRRRHSSPNSSKVVVERPPNKIRFRAVPILDICVTISFPIPDVDPVMRIVLFRNVSLMILLLLSIPVYDDDDDGKSPCPPPPTSPRPPRRIFLSKKNRVGSASILANVTTVVAIAAAMAPIDAACRITGGGSGSIIVQLFDALLDSSILSVVT
mmetsp:Transcript_42884/g.103625  ORF Transcript_42884/g.103625 Transcript_42884/m.103625 type:complete len:247 (+) Transcript_42884:1479-2219(+)